MPTVKQMDVELLIEEHSNYFPLPKFIAGLKEGGHLRLALVSHIDHTLARKGFAVNRKDIFRYLDEWIKVMDK